MRSQTFVPDGQIHEIMTGVPVTATVCPLHFPDPRILAFLALYLGTLVVQTSRETHGQPLLQAPLGDLGAH